MNPYDNLIVTREKCRIVLKHDGGGDTYPSISGWKLPECLYSQNPQNAELQALEIERRFNNFNPLQQKLKEMLQLWDDNHPDDKCACMAASEDQPHPGPCLLCQAREILK